MTRGEALEVLHEYTKSESLRRHALQVEVCVAAYARHFGEDETQWRVTALLHDFDYEIHPNAPEHPMHGEPILEARGLLDQALFAQRVGWPDQLLGPAAAVAAEEQPYFSLLLVRQGWPAVLP